VIVWPGFIIKMYGIGEEGRKGNESINWRAGG
jgi:hypothetical protein